MVTGFEKETEELTDFELKICDIIVPKLSLNIGSKKMVTNIEIRRKLQQMGWKIGAARIRKIIHYIRVNKLIVNFVSTNRGYYIAENQEQIDKYVMSLQERINSIESVKKSFIKV